MQLRKSRKASELGKRIIKMVLWIVGLIILIIIIRQLVSRVFS